MFTKEDLKNRMIVETEDGRRWIVIDGLLIGNDGFMRINDYTDDLLDYGPPDNGSRRNPSPYDIKKVFAARYDLNITAKESSMTCLFCRNTNITHNRDIVLDFCKQLSECYRLDNDRLYSYFLDTLFKNSKTCGSVLEFDIEKCTEKEINDAIHEIGYDCSTYYMLKCMAKD